MSYAKKTLFGTIWNVGLNIYNQAASFVIYALLARILLVEDFGLIAFCFLLTEMTVLLGNFGVNQILIQRHRWSQKLATNCFWFLLTAGALLGIILAVVAGPISDQFFYSGSWPMLAALGLIPILNSISLVSYARLMRSFQFRKIAVYNMISTTVGAILSIWGVLNGYGVWAVVWGRVLQTLSLSICVILTDRFIPNLTFSVRIFRVILRFGLPLFYQTSVNFLADRSVALATAALLGATQFAYIALAQRAFRMIRDTTITPLNGILLSAFSRLKEKDKIAEQYVRVVKMASMIIIPLFIGAAAVSHELIEIAFGDKWQISSTLFTLLCFTIICNSLVWYIPQALVSLNRPDMSFKLTAITAITNFTFCLTGAIHSTMGAVIGLLCASLFLMPIKFRIAKNHLPLSLLAVLIAASPAIFASCVMFATVRVSGIFIDLDNIFLNCIIKVFIGIFTYLFCYAFLFKKQMRCALTEIRTLTRK